MLSRLVIVFLPRSKHLSISWLQSPSAVILEPKKVVCHCFHCFPICLPWRDGTGCHMLVFWMLSFKSAFSVSSFTFIKRLFSSSLLLAVRVVSSAYLRLLIFLLAIFIPVCASSSLAFHIMYSAYKLNKQLWHTPLPIWNQSVIPCPVLSDASWPAYRFLEFTFYQLSEKYLFTAGVFESGSKQDSLIWPSLICLCLFYSVIILWMPFICWNTVESILLNILDLVDCLVVSCSTFLCP